MIIGVPTEIKAEEFRVALTPDGVRDLYAAGHRILVQEDAGLGSGITNQEYMDAGAEIVVTAAEVFKRAAMIVKVKEPLAAEYDYLRQDLIIFTYLHLAPLPELTAVLMAKKVTAFGYETVQLADGSLPLLAPMSEVAGKLAIQAGAHFLEKEEGGRGVLLGGVSGVKQGNVLILGAGTVGRNAARIAVGMGAAVTVIDRDRQRLARLDDEFGERIVTRLSAIASIKEEISKADLVVGAVLIPGDEAPKLINREMLKGMKKGSVIVDVAIDQGGCVETSRPTTHADPVYAVDDIIHYCVANMPGVVPRTSTFALTIATLPYIAELAEKGVEGVLLPNNPLKRGLYIYNGLLVNRAVADAQGGVFS